MKDIRNYNKEWRYIDAFQRFVSVLNDCAIKLESQFQFESFHFSNTGKTINDIGYDSLMNHINLLEEMIPNLTSHETEKKIKIK